MAIIPIWKDYPITIDTTDDYVDYTIKLGDNATGTVIYSGRAYKLPGANSVRIIPNEVCAPFVATNEELYYDGGYKKNRMAKTFTLSASTSNFSPATFAFGADRTYKAAQIAKSNDPITGRVGALIPIPMSFYNVKYTPGGSESVEWTFTIIFKSGEEATIRYNTKELSIETSNIFSKSIESERFILHNPGGDVEYRLSDICAKYYLYYINAYGAWDLFMIEGSGKKTDDYSRTSFNQAYETISSRLQPRGTVCLQNDITRKYTLVTGWLTDDEASRMHHLLGSTNVYLFDVDENRYLPVVLTNSSCEYKTYRNQGAQLVNYTIEATVAQTYTRR